MAPPVLMADFQSVSSAYGITSKVSGLVPDSASILIAIPMPFSHTIDSSRLSWRFYLSHHFLPVNENSAHASVRVPARSLTPEKTVKDIEQEHSPIPFCSAQSQSFLRNSLGFNSVLGEHPNLHSTRKGSIHLLL
ncbi:hypothetical protein J6590_046040 [Homalodisca vitripennis]|nr:hypothetical protein J6590_046040 [Homalodisca vitripennis]